MTITLSLDGAAPVPVNFNTAAHGRTSYLYQYAGDHAVRLASDHPAEFANELRRLADKLEHLTIAEVQPEPGIIRGDNGHRPNLWQRTIDPLTLTPGQVIAFFEQSPVLSVYADDVRAVLEPLLEEDTAAPVSQLSQDLAAVRPYRDRLIDADGQLLYGSQSRIAEILDLTNAGHDRKRILAVAGALQKEVLRESSTSTTPPAAVEIRSVA